jgi:hypothetical protein
MTPSKGMGLPHIAQGRVGNNLGDLGITITNIRLAVQNPMNRIIGFIVIPPVSDSRSREKTNAKKTMVMDNSVAKVHFPRTSCLGVGGGMLTSDPRIWITI